MLTFCDWLIVQDAEALLALLENAEFFNPQDYNAVFDGELESLAQFHHDPEVQKEIEALRDFDWGNYLVRSLVRAGFRGDDVQEHLHEIAVRLLVSPGKLFRGWIPTKHGPLQRRFAASVWNAIRNIVEKQHNYRRRVVNADPSVMAERQPTRPPYSGVLDDFRKAVAEQLGDLAAAILDWRVRGLDTKDLVGRPELGSPTVWKIKKGVGDIKKLARRFAATRDDPAFLDKVNRAMEREATTVAKRKAARPPR